MLRNFIGSICIIPANSALFLAPISPIASHQKSAAHVYRRRPSKFSGYGIVPSGSSRYMLNRKLGRTFAKDYLKTFGTDQTHESLKLILSTQGPAFRRLDANKKKQLSEIYINILPNVINTIKALDEILLITKIELPDLLTEIRVYWRCTGDVERDQVIQDTLTENAGIIRKQTREMLHNFWMPPLKFMEDRKHLTVEEMDKLFEMADYGAEHKTHNKMNNGIITAAASNNEKAKTPPRWLESWRRRVRENERKEKSKKSVERPSNEILNLIE